MTCFFFCLVQVKQLLEKEKGHVVASCRNPEGATGLHHLKSKFAERLSVLQLDVTNESTIEVNIVRFSAISFCSLAPF